LKNNQAQKTIEGGDAGGVHISKTIGSNEPGLHYGIVIDCGSSGSRLYIYVWPDHSGNPNDLLQIKQLLDENGVPVVKKLEPGN
jgi:GDA1/CD39 (nucleoside phosphatase) family